MSDTQRRYTTEELIALAEDRGPFALDNLRLAIRWAARTLDAADIAVRAEYARAESLKPQPVKQADDDKVICPQCCNQFRAIPVNVQQLLLDAGFGPPFKGAKP